MIVGVDMGGTFTDVVAYDATGAVRTAKAPTTPDGVGGVPAAPRQVAEAAGVEAVAIAFLHAYADDAHERRAADLIAAAMPGVRVLKSSEVNPERKEYERTSTTVIAAGLAPVIDRALGTIEDTLREAGLP